QMGAYSFVESDGEIEQLRVAAHSAGSMVGKEYVSRVTCKETYEWSELPWDPEKNSYPQLTPGELLSRPHCVVIDCGVKRNILRLLTASGFRLSVVPSHTTAEK